MSEERSPALERLFRAADKEIDGDAFVSDVMASTSPHRARLVIGLAVVLIAVPVAWLVAGPLNDALLWLTQFMARPLAGTGESFTSPAVLPMNTVGGALVLALLALRAVARRLFSSY
ncbi:MAG TPA: hypothetical protein VGL98_04505 [Gammaproteobacteria bacterium]